MAKNRNAGDGVGKSYRDKVLGRDGITADESESETEEMERDGDEAGEGMKVEERTVGDFECPEFVFSKQEEKRIYRPWRRGVIVKLLGRRIGYKALETRLKQMWVRKGVISIIDLSNDYYLVAFTHEDDQYAALMDGPWFIYDHYLTVKEWSPNFHPETDTIEKVAVWMRITGLPIEYYDARILNFIGNRVGKTVKVDKNTLLQERGKYARLCVQVDLTKPLLAMFTIKGRKYNVEYEGLHMLCLTCGKFGHYKEGCQDKSTKQASQQQGGNGGVNGGIDSAGIGGSETDGPWRVVKKTRRNRKSAPNKNASPEEGRGNNTSVKINSDSAVVNGGPKITGSRFVTLSDENIDINESDMGREKKNISSEIIKEVEDVEEIPQIVISQQKHNMRNKKGSNGGSMKKGEGNQEKINREAKLAPRGGGNFKGKNGSSIKKGVDNLAEMMGINMMESLKAQYQRPKITKGDNSSNLEVCKVIDSEKAIIGRPGANTLLGRADAENPIVTRPPDLQNTPPIENYSTDTQVDPMGVEAEIFVDANDQGSVGTSESDMEFVAESIDLD
jgi:hypothetical protein